MKKPEISMESVGRNLRLFRERKSLSVEEVREYMEFASVQSIYKYESGRCWPQADNLLALMLLYDIEVRDLLEYEGSMRHE